MSDLLSHYAFQCDLPCVIDVDTTHAGVRPLRVAVTVRTGGIGSRLDLDEDQARFLYRTLTSVFNADDRVRHAPDG